MMGVAVFGSINMDLVTRIPHLPGAGETLTGKSFLTIPGGKGANQAVACARLGVETAMIGRVGGDEFGTRLIAELSKAGVNNENIVIDPDTSSGIALIAVEDSAENFIIVVPGANGCVNQSDLQRLDTVLPKVNVLLLQLEIPMEIVLAAARKAKEQGVLVVLDPAPVQALPKEIFPFIDIITPNESEAISLVGGEIQSQDDAVNIAKKLHEYGVETVIIKMGKQGALALVKDEVHFFKCFSVDAVDTVAAGDAFNGSLAVALSEGVPLLEAIQWGMAGGALSVMKEGAQPSMPERKELLKLLKT